MGRSVVGRMASTIKGPMVMLGTKRPSITSMWTQSAPATSMAFTCEEEERRGALFQPGGKDQ